jgi:ferredoxin-type protein NapF
LVSSKNIRLIFLGLTLLFALPLGWGKLTGVSAWLSPYIVLNSVLALKSFVVLNIIGFAVLTAGLFKRNFFCRYLCPLGAVLDKIPGHQGQKPGLSLKRIPHFGIWLAVISLASAAAGLPLFIYLDPVSVFNSFFSAFLQTTLVAVIASLAGLTLIVILQYFFRGLWCFRICPLGGLQMLLTDIRSFFSQRRGGSMKTDTGRRLFLGTAAGVAASALLPGIVGANDRKIIRPPASLKPGRMAMICTRCGSCIKTCPTKILTLDTRLTAEFLTPAVVFDRGYCIETCNRCSVVCPSGAITLFETAAKPEIRMGLAEVRTSDCLLTLQKECDRCKAVCPYKAVEIAIPGKSGLMIPLISDEKCTGCGACMVICPVKCISIVPMA